MQPLLSSGAGAGSYCATPLTEAGERRAPTIGRSSSHSALLLML